MNRRTSSDKETSDQLEKGDIILGPADDRPIGDLFYCSRPNLEQKFRQYIVVKDDEEKPMSNELKICGTCTAFDPENQICNKNGLETDELDTCPMHTPPEEEK